MNLKEAHEKALRDAEDGFSKDQYIAMYLTSLDISGFVIVPKEATIEMENGAKRAGIFDPRVAAFTYHNMLAGRPKLDDQQDQK